MNFHQEIVFLYIFSQSNCPEVVKNTTPESSPIFHLKSSPFENSLSYA